MAAATDTQSGGEIWGQTGDVNADAGVAQRAQKKSRVVQNARENVSFSEIVSVLENTLVAEEPRTAKFVLGERRSGLELTRLSHGYDRVNRESSNPVVYKVGDKLGMDPPMPLAAASLWRIWNELSVTQQHQVEQFVTELMVGGTG